MTRWYVGSFADGDTHLAEPVPDEHLVTAHCDGRRFRPLAALPATPPDPDQICPACWEDRHHDASQEADDHAGRAHEPASPAESRLG